ncbi:hypothetical protein [Luteolibacter marinus]|uniref:hypothetical protein n=1 Tax=Luteolibacter marinus TaxID=2776705 RepID=UPI001868EF13|nr:hypothetical protein [Luteolibacter marinus]
MKLLILPLFAVPLLAAPESITLENQFLKRVVTVGESIGTTSITNKLDGRTLALESAEAFVIHLADGTSLAASDFTATGIDDGSGASGQDVTLHLSCADPAVGATVRYQLGSGDFYLRKSVTLTPEADLAVADIEVESLKVAGAYQPYTMSQITARGAGQWRPGLGQPLYTRESGTFWGLEYPAAVNRVTDGHLICSKLVGTTLPAGKVHIAPSAVFGVAGSPDFVQDAFFDYIDRTRIRPLRLQTQYNSWFDFGPGVDAGKFASSVETIHRELVTGRGVPPLKAYVIDDGWQDKGADWSKGLWPVNGKFDPSFESSFKVASAAGSQLGLWLSPGALFGASAAIPKMKAAGLRSLDPWMSLDDPAYTGLLEKRMVELARAGVGYFKLDGIFGHLNTRNFDIEGFKGGEAELNDPKYDRQKIQYLSDGTDRLVRIFAAMAGADPDIYIVISNGAWLSPWWLQHIDAVWMINAGDAASGADRTGELTYRDEVYHQLAVEEQTQFPLHSIFNHEPKKTSSEETKDSFRRYLYMNLSRGTGFIELYLKTPLLKDYDWDVLAEGLHWAHAVFPTFKRSRMHGGDPGKGEVYGYTAWNDRQGYVSIHNPSAESRTYEIKLDRRFGLGPGAVADQTLFHLSSPLAGSLDGLAGQYRPGDVLRFTLRQKEIRILNFDTEPRDWSVLEDLQARTAADYQPPEPVDLTGHPLLGTWSYFAGGVAHSREFRADGTCILRQGNKVNWTKSFTAGGDGELVVEGGYRHRLNADGTLDIEGRYTGKRAGKP